MKKILIGTAGHVDHGKTTLIQALTGIDTDRLKEEKKRGITIDLGYAYLPMPDGNTASIIDVPGHEKFIKNMLAGATGINLVLLVIASDDGVMPQTREHVSILNMLGATDGIIVLTKCDTTENEWRALITEDIREAVKNTFLGTAPIVEVSAHTGQGIEVLKDMLYEKLQGRAEETTGTNTPRLPIDRVFTAEGFGTIVTGTLIEGSLSVGDNVMRYPALQSAKIRSLQVHGGEAQTAYAGQRVAVNLSGIHHTEITRGDVLAAPDSLQPTKMLDVKLMVLPDSKREIKSGTRLHFYYGTHDIVCKAVLMGYERLAAGQSAYTQLRFTENVALKQGDRFVVRFYSPLETIGGGIVLNENPKKHRKGKTDESNKNLQRREETQVRGDITALIQQAIADESANLTPLQDIQKKLGTPDDIFQSALTTLSQSRKITRIPPHHAIDETYQAQLATRLQKCLTDYHKTNPLQPGMRKEELRNYLHPNSKPALFDALLHLYTTDETAPIRITNNRIALSGFSVKLDPIYQAIRAYILTCLNENPFTPPTPEELAAPWAKQKKAPAFQQMLDALFTEETLIATEPGIIFTAAAVNEAKSLFTQLCNGTAPVTLAQFRDALNTSRKFALSLLEYFDRIGFTGKEGDGRVLKCRPIR